MMYIKHAYIEGYKRFLLKDIKSLTLTHKEVLYLILGSNGSGKSSLFELLSLLPPEKSDFKKNSRLEFIVELDSSIYEIKYKIGKTVTADFIKDGVELNKGHTITVQRDLIKTYLKYDKDIHQLMTDKIVFTTMSPSKRREWFTRLSTVDMTYLMSVFDRARIAARDVKGAIKNVDTRLVAAQAKVADIVLEDDLEARINTLADTINNILRETDSSLPGRERVLEQITTARGLMSRGIKRCKDLGTIYNPSETAATGEVLEQELKVAIFKKEATLGEINSTSSELSELTEVLNKLKESENYDIGDLKSRKSYLASQIEELGGGRYFKYDQDINEVDRATRELSTRFISFCEQLHSNVRPDFTREEAIEFNSQRAELENECTKCEWSLNTDEARLADMLSREQVECPNCTHNWHLDFSQEEESVLRRSIDRCKEFLKANKPKLDNLNTKVSLWKTYRDVMKQFRDIRDEFPMLNDLWLKIIEAEYIETEPVKAANLFVRYVNGIEKEMELRSSTEEHTRISDILERLENNPVSNNQEYMCSRSEVLSNRLDTLRLEVDSLDKQISDSEDFIEHVRKYNEAVEYIMDGRSLLEESLRKLAEVGINDALLKQSRVCQEQLTALTNKKNAYDSLVAVINDLEDNKALLESDADCWKKIVRSLSPETGLIAKQISGHIGLFVKKMNRIISKIWEYDLIISSCGVEEGELDLNYKFPLSVPSRTSSVPDVANSSKAQGDVINFAFKLIAMEYLGIREYPLFADELGASFDTEHRVKLVHFLNDLINSGRTRQMFLINHYVSSYGGLNNPEVLVLDETNVVLPEIYNTHAVFK